jgi:hypothetical protein
MNAVYSPWLVGMVLVDCLSNIDLIILVSPDCSVDSLIMVNLNFLIFLTCSFDFSKSHSLFLFYFLLIQLL